MAAPIVPIPINERDEMKRQLRHFIVDDIPMVFGVKRLGRIIPKVYVKPIRLRKYIDTINQLNILIEFVVYEINYLITQTFMGPRGRESYRKLKKIKKRLMKYYRILTDEPLPIGQQKISTFRFTVLYELQHELHELFKSMKGGEKTDHKLFGYLKTLNLLFENPLNIEYRDDRLINLICSFFGSYYPYYKENFTIFQVLETVYSEINGIFCVYSDTDEKYTEEQGHLTDVRYQNQDLMGEYQKDYRNKVLFSIMEEADRLLGHIEKHCND